MVAIGIAKLMVLSFVAVGILLFEGSQVVGLGALILGGGEAKLAYTARLADDALERLHVLSLLGDYDKLEIVLGL